MKLNKTIHSALFTLLFLTISVGCHEVTEYQSNYASSVKFIRTSDYTVDRTMGGIEQGRSIIAYQDSQIMVISADGYLHRIDAENMQIDTSYAIGASSGTGYGETEIALNGHLYVSGPGSQVIDVDVMNNRTNDQFVPGSLPGAFCASPVENKLYITDTDDYCIDQIWTGGNTNGWTSSVQYQPVGIMIEPVEGRKIVVVCSNGAVYGIWLDWSTVTRQLTNPGTPCSCIEPAWGDSAFCIAYPEWTKEDGFVVFRNGFVQPAGARTEPVRGHPIDICSSLDGLHLYVLSRLDSGNTVVTVFEYSFGTPEFLTEIEIDGFARDFVSCWDGEYILVLTSE